MSIANLFIDNSFDLNCSNLNVKNKFKSKIFEAEQFIIDQIEVNTALVNTSITTPHINSGTSVFNTVGTIDLDAVNGTIGTLDSNTATIDNLTINNSLTVPSLTTPTINCTNMNASNNITVGNTATINTLNVDTQLNCPLIGVDTVQTNGTGSVTVINPLVAPTIQLSTISGTPSTPLNFYYYDNTGTVTVSGAINPSNVGFRVTRIGNSVSFQLNSFPTSTCTNGASALLFNVPSIIASSVVCRGLVVVLNGATSIVARWILSGTSMTINAGLNPTDFWTVGNVCTIAGGTWNFQWVI